MESLVASLAAALLSSSMLLVFSSLFLIASTTSTTWSAINLAQMATLVIYAYLVYVLTTLGKHNAPARQNRWKASAAAHVFLVGGWFIALGKLTAVLIAPEVFCLLLHWPGLAFARRAAPTV